MPTSTRLSATSTHIRRHWPAYLGLYATCILSLMAIGLGLVTGWYALIPFALAAILAAGYLLVTTLWAVRKVYDQNDPLAILYTLSNHKPVDEIANIELGTRSTSIWLARHLTTGSVAAIDVYNPESNTSAALRRARLNAVHLPADPRLAWIDGRTNLLPLADRSVKCVFLNEVLSEFWEVSERERLLNEVYRVLEPDGRALIAEPVRTQTSLLLRLPNSIDAKTAEEWKLLLRKTGFEVRAERDIEGLLVCLRADRPSDEEARQLTLGLEYL